MARRRVAFQSQSGISSFVSKDAVFMNKISNALKTVHENYGYKAVQDCLQTDDVTGEADVDLDVLCAMLDRSKSKLKSECCAMFFASKSVMGSLLYLFGSLLFGSLTYFNTLSTTMRTFFSVAATTLYLLGGILFIIAAIEPYWLKTLEINEVSQEVYDLKERGKIVAVMSGTRKSQNRIKARMSKLNIDAIAMLRRTEGESTSDSDDIFGVIAEEQKTSPSKDQQLEMSPEQQKQFDLLI
eukprot:266979_1